MNKINWKVRIHNPIFIGQILLSIIVPILGYYGLTAEDITSWTKLFEVLWDAVLNPYVVFLIVVSLWNAINDPTTKGVSDSELAKSYNQPK
ncbi:holin [Bacillus sp. 7586-K]|nr:holin [Bacillus sp. 7586-K]